MTVIWTVFTVTECVFVGALDKGLWTRRLVHVFINSSATEVAWPVSAALWPDLNMKFGRDVHGPKSTN